ncbi:MAG: CinA family protein, partial [Phormidesmis sp.]
WGISVTGIAGPGGGSAQKPVGLVYVGLATAGKALTKKYLFGEALTRAQIRQRSALSALDWLRTELLGKND